MARRKAIRFSIWSAMPRASSAASRSGSLTSLMFSLTGPVGHGLQGAAEALGLTALATDDHTGPGGVDVHDQPVAGPLDVDPGQGAPGQLSLEILADAASPR